ncbi:uncharacterized protein H6S33_008138 [Morchella sextelata]|uniref:uncharacterized protein n=1 Tax=Morchella sextelata TaxID=1174677 RepID=UPI001D04777F|nr:uncharacterized protein H6S33_008138 [Morchella sextelata]KAH0603134.1 hypothetical protein H6S33_008138 [Morchella sextelata]
MPPTPNLAFAYLLRDRLYWVRQEIARNENDLSEAFERRQATATKLAFLRSVLRSMGYNPMTRSTGPNVGVPVLIPWILTQMRRERNNLAINDDRRRSFRRIIVAGRVEELEWLKQISAYDARIEAYTVALLLAEEKKMEAESVSLRSVNDEDNSGTVLPSDSQA